MIYGVSILLLFSIFYVQIFLNLRLLLFILVFIIAVLESFLTIICMMIDSHLSIPATSGIAMIIFRLAHICGSVILLLLYLSSIVSICSVSAHLSIFSTLQLLFFVIISLYLTSISQTLMLKLFITTSCFCASNSQFMFLYSLNTYQQSHLSYQLFCSMPGYFHGFSHSYFMNFLQVHLFPNLIHSTNLYLIMFIICLFEMIVLQMLYPLLIFYHTLNCLTKVYADYLITNQDPCLLLICLIEMKWIFYSLSHSLFLLIIHSKSSFLFWYQEVGIFVVQIIHQLHIFFC